MARKRVPARSLWYLVLVLLVGCLLIPHRERDFPDTTGVLTVNGAPLGNAAVAGVILPPGTADTALAHVCRVASPLVRIASRTDAQGRFHFLEHEHWATRRAVLGDPWEYGWALCVVPSVTAPGPAPHGAALRLDSTAHARAEAGAWRLVYATAYSGALSVAREEYACDLGARAVDEWRTYGRVGQCRVVLPPEPPPFTHPLPPVTTSGSS